MSVKQTVVARRSAALQIQGPRLPPHPRPLPANRLGEAMIDVVLGAGELKGVGAEKALRREFDFDFIGSETVA